MTSEPSASREVETAQILARLRLRARLEQARARSEPDTTDQAASLHPGSNAAPPAVGNARLGPPPATRAQRRAEASERAETWRGRLRITLSPKLAGAALACLAAVAAAAVLWRGHGSEPDTVPLEMPTAPASAPATRAAPSASSEAWVHVAGQVRTPGLVRLPPGARVAQALEAAGGPLPKADLARLNLARKITDGEQVYVPAQGESAPGTAAGGEPGAAAGAGSGGAGGSGGVGPDGAAVNVNTADAATLDSLPGVGPVLAGRIVEHREANGPFAAVDDLLAVSGIGPSVLDKLRDRATVS